MGLRKTKFRLMTELHPGNQPSKRGGCYGLKEKEDIGSLVTISKSAQAYIDERPIWPDGTLVAKAPMTAMQWRIWSLAAAGKFFEGLVVFMTGVALPLIADEFGISNPALPYICRFTAFSRLMCPSAGPLVQP
jgi:hypothetical protein